MSKIKEAFEKKKVFVGFLTAGDPNLAKTEEFILKMQEAGAGLIEIGIPFSDPIAEGPVIQEANVRALSNEGGCTLDMVFDMVERIRPQVTVPLVFLTYLNPVFRSGYDRFSKKCAEVGIDGFIIPDMPYEESAELTEIAAGYGVDKITLIAPTSDERVQMLAKDARGYIYLVSSMGVTGERNEITTDLGDIVAKIRQVTDTPVAIGFGIHSPEQAEKLGQLADGVIVGSAIVKLIAKYGTEAGEPVAEYVRSMSKALK
ncbi:MAG: tryptophan synthase subunit alpha [Lachnospiraceae bacterium]|nr:tryptophan synthase subunit alpha [Lachnospiraceae bacterium]